MVRFSDNMQNCWNCLLGQKRPLVSEAKFTDYWDTHEIVDRHIK